MIQIENSDRPIDVFTKLIDARMPEEARIGETVLWKAEVERFTPEELKEIAEYLLVYYNNHKEIEENELVSQ